MGATETLDDRRSRMESDSRRDGGDERRSVPSSVEVNERLVVQRLTTPAKLALRDGGSGDDEDRSRRMGVVAWSRLDEPPAMIRAAALRLR
mmetsp:Transcript_97884/g.279966  ORF Transcript_97884/g.279966 Transcript_97884/m.279966 type:complete len:91 (+) Transcript_97884:666-938(+)